MTDEQRPQPGDGWVDWPAAVPAPAPVPAPPQVPASAGIPNPYAAPPAPPPYGGHGGAWGDAGWDPAWGALPYGGVRPDGTPARPFPVGRRLGFVDSVRSGVRLAGTCWRVLMRDKEDLLVPLAAMLVGVALILPYVQLLGGWDGLATGRVGVVKLFPLMLLLCVVDVFAAATLVGSATIRLSGGNPTLTDGWVQALSRAPKLIRFAFAWAVQQAISAWLRNRGRGGQIAANLFDTAWNVATFLAIPVMLYEPELSATKAVKRSAKLVGQRWGPGLVGNTGLQLAVFCCGLPVVLGLALVGSVFGMTGALVGFFVGLLGLICVASALRGIFAAALYRFATTGLTAPGFRDPDLWNAFARPTGRRR